MTNQTRDKYVCDRCDRVFTKKQSYCAHRSHCGKNNRSLTEEGRSRQGWNRGLNVSDARVAKNTEGVRASWACLSPEELEDRARKISEGLKKRYSSNTSHKTGGYRRGAGRSWKKGFYKGIWCDSSWELAWILYQEGQGVSFERNEESFAYEFQGKLRKYIPDFKLPDGSFVEVKGWRDGKCQSKMDQFQGKLILLGPEEMKPILEWVILHHGRDFISLYDIN